MTLAEHLAASLVTAENRRRVEKPRPTLSLSKSGKCARSLSYQLCSQALTLPVPATSLARMDLGRVCEDWAVALINGLPGWTVTEQQKEVFFDVGSERICGHIDGIVTEQATGKRYLLEIKSANRTAPNLSILQSRSWWIRAYFAQAQAYLDALGMSEALMLFVNRGSGEVHEELISHDRAAVEQIRARFRRVLAATYPMAELRECVPNQDGKLADECQYCDWARECWGQVDSRPGRYDKDVLYYTGL